MDKNIFFRTCELAIRINQLITQARSRQYSKMVEASPKDLWDAVNVTRGNRTCQSNYSACLFQDLDSANNYFASVVAILTTVWLM